MSTRWWTFGIAALAAASAVHWGLQVFARPGGVPPGTQVAQAGPVGQGDLTRLLGVDAPPPVAVSDQPPPDARFQLLGVVAPKAAGAAREGLALIAVDGQPAKAYRVGAVVDGQTILKSVAARGAQLGTRDGPAQVSLDLQPPQPAAMGTLPSANTAVGATPTPQALLPQPVRQASRPEAPQQVPALPTQ